MYKSLSTKGKKYSGKICRPRERPGFFRGILPVAYRRICNGFLAFWLAAFSMAWDKYLYYVVCCVFVSLVCVFLFCWSTESVRQQHELGLLVTQSNPIETWKSRLQKSAVLLCTLQEFWERSLNPEVACFDLASRRNPENWSCCVYGNNNDDDDDDDDDVK